MAFNSTKKVEVEELNKLTVVQVQRSLPAPRLQGQQHHGEDRDQGGEVRHARHHLQRHLQHTKVPGVQSE